MALEWNRAGKRRRRGRRRRRRRTRSPSKSVPRTCRLGGTSSERPRATASRPHPTRRKNASSKRSSGWTPSTLRWPGVAKPLAAVTADVRDARGGRTRGGSARRRDAPPGSAGPEAPDPAARTRRAPRSPPSRSAPRLSRAFEEAQALSAARGRSVTRARPRVDPLRRFRGLPDVSAPLGRPGPGGSRSRTGCDGGGSGRGLARAVPRRGGATGQWARWTLRRRGAGGSPPSSGSRSA